MPSALSLSKNFVYTYFTHPLGHINFYINNGVILQVTALWLSLSFMSCVLFGFCNTQQAPPHQNKQFHESPIHNKLPIMPQLY